MREPSLGHTALLKAVSIRRLNGSWSHGCCNSSEALTKPWTHLQMPPARMLQGLAQDLLGRRGNGAVCFPGLMSAFTNPLPPPAPLCAPGLSALKLGNAGL